MQWKIIKTEEDYRKAMDRLEQIFDAVPDTPQGEELELLSLLIDHYEREVSPIDPPDPVDAIRFRMEQTGMQQKDLATAIGSRSHTSEILHRKRKLSLEIIRKLHQVLGIPTDVLVREY